MTYLPKPMQSDSVKVKNYVSLSFANNVLPYDAGDMDMGFVNYSRAHVFKHINLSYGGYAFAGSTSSGSSNSLRPVSPQYVDQGILGAGLRTSLGYAEQAGNTEFRVISWENALAYEAGGYANFREDIRAKRDTLSVSSLKTMFYTTGASTEIIWYGKKNQHRQYGFRLFLGTTFGLNKDINYTNQKITGIATDLSFYFKVRNVYAILSHGTNLSNSSGKISLGYSW